MEYVVWGSAGSMGDGDRGVGCLPGLIRYPVRQADKFHQAGKPLQVMQELVKICPPGGLVLDPFAGSGTTLLAARNLGRRALGIEQEPVHVATCLERFRQESLELPEL
jgi:site-specific DNA-methyltransferase (adenine-specific)